MVNSQKNPIEKQFEDCARESIRTINHNIISKIDNYDSIQYYAKKLIKEISTRKNLKPQNLTQLTGKPQIILPDELLCLFCIPHRHRLFKWEPNDYYLKLMFYLMLFAEKI